MQLYHGHDDTFTRVRFFGGMANKFMYRFSKSENTLFR